MAEKDIAPELIEKVNKDFEENLSKDKKAAGLKEKLSQGSADYADAYEYAESVGTARAKAFGEQISSEVLPDGRMYYNIASRLMEETLTADHNMVSEFASGVQKTYNEKAGIGLKALRADLDEDRIDGFVQRLASEEDYDEVSWLLDEPVVTHARSVVDDTIKKNAEFQHKSGIKATVTRRAAPRCCDWCTDLEGDYTYPNVDGKVFQRHDHCKCTVDYEGRRLTAYEGKSGSHSFRDQGELKRIEARREQDEKGFRFKKRSDIIESLKNSSYSLNRARNIRSIDDLHAVSDSAIISLDGYQEILKYFEDMHGVKVEGFSNVDLFGVKATLAGLDDMMVAFPEIKDNIITIRYAPNMKDMGSWSSDGLVKIGKNGLQDYGTGVHEASHALDYVRSGKTGSYAEKVVNEARKSLGLRKNGKNYKYQCIRITADAEDAECPEEVFAYAIETAKGGVRIDLADEIYRIVLEGKK